MNAISNDVQNLVAKELNAANEKFPLFSSSHEGYAVILEEVEECVDELNQIEKVSMRHLWYSIRANVKGFDAILKIKGAAIRLACEAIQVAAMCDKYIISTEKGADE